ncbi:MAG: DUF4292 domain-containing protein [Cytophagales bacterium]|nr:MAG: DUF4292 domain-containing protein [Cytophagales bacterium]TAF59259.1 MAG: DUF4292 domain-containing protein [Cytophagales bacterium]
MTFSQTFYWLRLTFLMCLVLVLLASSCKSSQKTNIPQELAGKLRLEQFEFTYLSMRSKLDIDMGSSIKTAAEIRIKHDSIIWISMRPALNIEMLRLIITKDSICFMNKLNKTYSSMTFKELSQVLGMDASYNLVEDLVVGNLVNTGGTFAQPEKLETEFLLKQEHPKYNLEARVSRQNAKVTHYKVVQTGASSPTVLTYAQFARVGKLYFPHQSDMQLLLSGLGDSPQEGKLRVEHEKVELPLKAPAFSFKIPDNYSRVSLENK